MSLAALLVAVAVLAWPDADRRSATAPPEAAPPRPATVEEAAAALGLVAAALRGGVGAVEALEAVAAVDPGAAGRELAGVAAALDHLAGEGVQSAGATEGLHQA